MKKIVLIGDSVRMGYDKYVKEALAGVAEVYYPNENCRYALNVLRFLHEWKKSGEWPSDVDLVHWNAGLWDVLELFGDGPLSTKEFYEYTIPRIDKRLRMLFPNAKIVFATSTSVIEKESGVNFTRHNSTIREYNEAAVRALKDTDTVINDLYTTSELAPKEVRSDWVHFRTKEGAEYMGGKVISVICKMLDISPSEVNIENFEPEKYSEGNIGY